MIDNAFRMNRLTLRFADAGAEAAYAAGEAHKAQRPFRIAAVAAFAFMLLLWAVLDRIAPKVAGAQAFSAKWMLLSLAGIAIFFLLTYRPIFLRWQQSITLIAASIFSLGAIRYANLTPLEMLRASGFTVFVIHIFNCYAILRLRFPQATVAGWLTAVAYLSTFAASEILIGHELIRHGFILFAVNGFGMVAAYQMDLYARREFTSMRLLGEERARSERLLLNILPVPIAERLKASDESIAEHSDGVTVLFADIVGFTPLSASKTPQALVALLNKIFSEFDTLADLHGLEKIKTIGDAYMAVAGLPEERSDHAERAARMALAMRDAIARLAAETGEELGLRIGLHSGPVVAGVIGRRKFAYDMWGDTVNTASRMESHGEPGKVHCTEATAALLMGRVGLEPRGMIDIKGKGNMQTFFLTQLEEKPHG